MKFKILLLMFSLFAVFYLSSESANAACTALCPSSYCTGGYSYAAGCCDSTNVWGGCLTTGAYACDTPCENKLVCEGNSIADYKNQPAAGCTESLFFQATQCKKLTACSSPTPKCYASGSSASCVGCLTNADCTNPTKPDCDASTHTCYKITPVLTCSNGIQDNGETGVDCGGGGCPDCATPVCTSCSADGTLVGACSSTNPGKRCDEVSGVCSLYTDSSCTPGG